MWVSIALQYDVALLNKVLVYYNQVVDVNFRGVNAGKFYKTEEHYVFSLRQFQQQERQNSALKLLLDRLRGKALLKYYLHNVHPEATHKILLQIDFTHLPQSLCWKYKAPKSLVNLHQWAKKRASVIKQFLLALKS